MKRPSFQFYPGDWQSNIKLRKCSFRLKGVWLEMMLLFHDSDEYGLVRWTLKEIKKVIGCTQKDLDKLIEYGILKGTDLKEKKVNFEMIFNQNRSHFLKKKKENLIDSVGPLWYSCRMVLDEFLRKKRGQHGYKSMTYDVNMGGICAEKKINTRGAYVPHARAGVCAGPSSSSSSLKEVKEINKNLKDDFYITKKKNEGKIKPNGKISEENWKNFVHEQFLQLQQNEKWIQECESLWPRTNISKTIIANEEYWASREGWLNKKGNPNANWKSTLRYNFCGKGVIVWKDKKEKTLEEWAKD